MFCSQCGREIPAGQSACPFCNPVQPVQPVQPTAPVMPTEVIPSYLWLGILTTVCCCLPFGIVSIVYASRVSSCLAFGDVNGARNASANARMWGIIALICGLVGNLLGVGAQVFFGILGAAAQGPGA